MKLTVNAPKIAPARGGLLPLANIVTEDAGRAAWFGVKHDAILGGRSRFIPSAGQDKTFDKTGDLEGVEFVAYRGLESSLLVGVDAEALVGEAFDNAESIAVEDAVQRLLLNPAAVDLTPTSGTPVTDARHALGLLEQWAAENYSGVPLIHGNRLAVGLIPELQVKDDFSLFTIHGTPIANGGGYSADGPGVADAADGTAWLYISGQVNIWQGQRNVVEGPQLKANRDYTLVERPYAASLSGPVAAVLVGTN